MVNPNFQSLLSRIFTLHEIYLHLSFVYNKLEQLGRRADSIDEFFSLNLTIGAFLPKENKLEENDTATLYSQLTQLRPTFNEEFASFLAVESKKPSQSKIFVHEHSFKALQGVCSWPVNEKESPTQLFSALIIVYKLTKGADQDLMTTFRADFLPYLAETPPLDIQSLDSSLIQLKLGPNISRALELMENSLREKLNLFPSLQRNATFSSSIPTSEPLSSSTHLLKTASSPKTNAALRQAITDGDGDCLYNAIVQAAKQNPDLDPTTHAAFKYSGDAAITALKAMISTYLADPANTAEYKQLFYSFVLNLAKEDLTHSRIVWGLKKEVMDQVRELVSAAKALDRDDSGTTYLSSARQQELFSFMLKHQPQGGTLWNSYRASISEPGRWGGDLELGIIAKTAGLSVMVYNTAKPTNFAESPVETLQYEDTKGTLQTAYLHHALGDAQNGIKVILLFNGNHYCPLVVNRVARLNPPGTNSQISSPPMAEAPYTVAGESKHQMWSRAPVPTMEEKLIPRSPVIEFQSFYRELQAILYPQAPNHELMEQSNAQAFYNHLVLNARNLLQNIDVYALIIYYNENITLIVPRKNSKWSLSLANT